LLSDKPDLPIAFWTRREKIKKTLFNIVILLLFSASIIIGCVPTNVQNDQNVASDETKKIAEPNSSYKDVEGKLEELNALLKKGLITEDEYYKSRAKVLEGF
jgi:hypothetical protein